jgi:hypothetical protein
MDQEHSKYLHLFALVRYEMPVDGESIQNSVSVVKVFSDRELAGREAERLRAINGPAKCLYEVQVTRFVDGA